MSEIIYKVTVKLDGTDVKLTELSKVPEAATKSKAKGGRSKRNRKTVIRKRNTKRKSGII
jgi:hypothetical protein